MITLGASGYFFWGGEGGGRRWARNAKRKKKIASGQVNLQPHLHMMYEMRYLTKLVFEDYMTCILTVDDLEC